jgi:hypothetical protein
MRLPLPIKELPKPVSLIKLMGPSFIILGLGLGSGELILWPYLTAHYGMGIMWGALVGITFQFFMNMEIERYALVHGESIFVGFARKLRALPFWFILSTFIPWIWPGIIAAAAKVLGTLFGMQNTTPLAIVFLVAIGLILSLGKVLYKTQEFLQKLIVFIGVPTVFGLAVYLAKQPHWEALMLGLTGQGDGYWLLPAGIPIATFLGALAYSGAGGNLNLAQSFYIRDKGYGMGKYMEPIKGLIYGNKKDVKITGNKFEPTPKNMNRFKSWWRNINLEHFLVFWGTGTITMLLLGLLSYTLLYGKPVDAEGINFLFAEAKQIGTILPAFMGTFFLVVAGLTLISTQLGVFDATSRIISENVILGFKMRENKLPKIYYIVLWAQVAAGIVVLSSGFDQPLQLVIISAVLNAFAMFVHVGLTLWTNLTLLEKRVRPKMFRIAVMGLAFLFYGTFSAYVIIDKFLK